MDSRFAQYQTNQGGGSANFPGLQSMQQQGTGAFNLQQQQQSRPGSIGGGLPGTPSAQQPRLGAVTALQQQLGLQQAAAGRLNMPGQPQQHQFNPATNGLQASRPGAVNLTNFPSLQQQQPQQQQQQQQQGRPGMPSLGNLPPGTVQANLAAFNQRNLAMQGGLAGIAALNGRGNTNLGGLGSGNYASVPSGDLLSMLHKSGQQQRPLDDGPSFNASDFPSLSATGGTQQQQQPPQQRHSSQDGSDSMSGFLGNQRIGNVLAQQQQVQQLQQHQYQQQQQQQQGRPSFGEEDFPALPGSTGGGGDGSGGYNDALRLQQQRQQLQQQQQQHAAVTSKLQIPAGISVASHLHTSQQQQHVLSSDTIGTVTASHQLSSGAIPPPRSSLDTKNAASNDRYGLLGLLSVIKMIDPDVTTLALGTDLTTLGLNLNSPEALWKTFASPWADGPAKPDVDTKIPDCYLNIPPRLVPAYFGRFQPDTLFYIFYGMPGDEAQLYAADELSGRGWYYHKELKVWLTRVPNAEPLQKTDRFERGSFFVFDPSTWDVIRKDNFTVTFEALEKPPGLLKTSGVGVGVGGGGVSLPPHGIAPGTAVGPL